MSEQLSLLKPTLPRRIRAEWRGPTCIYPRYRHEPCWHHFAWWYDTTYTDAGGRVMPWLNQQITWPTVIEDWL